MAEQAQENLERELVDLIVGSVNLGHLDKETIKSDTALVGEGLNLDSIDMLEVIVAVENRYQVKVGNAENGRKHFRTVGTIVDFIQANTPS